MPHAGRSRAATLAFYTRMLNENESIPPEVKEAFAKGFKAIADQFYAAGVKAGYRKILLDHRDGNIDLDKATPAQLLTLIRIAEDEDFMPSVDINRIVNQ